MVYPEILLEPPKCSVEALEDTQLQLEEDSECGIMKMAESPPTTEPLKLKLLPPGHPLLQMFQDKLKKHLLHTKEQWLNDISEVKYEIKCKLQKREEKGANLYDMQQDIQRQNDQLEEYARSIQEQIEQRRKKEEKVALLKTEYVNKVNICKEEKTLHNKRLVELEDLNTLEGNIRRWANEIEDEVKNTKRVINKEGQLQRQLSEEKKRLDMLYYHLDMELRKRETELQGLREELKDSHEVLDILRMSIHSATTDLETLRKEHRSLSQAWYEVIVAISHRDKVLYQVSDANTKENELIKLKVWSIEASKKQITKEMAQNDKLESFRTSLLNDFMNLQRQCQQESDSLATLEEQLEELPRLMEQTEKDLQEANKEGGQLEIEIRRIQWKIDKQNSKIFNIEESILKLAQDELITDKASQHHLKLLHQSQQIRRSMECTLEQSKNQLSEVLLESEKCKGILKRFQNENESLRNKLFTVESKSDHLNSEAKSMDVQIDIKAQRIERLSNQLVDDLESMQIDTHGSVKRKIKMIEKLIQTEEVEMKKYQQFWLVLQNHYVNLTQKRNDQLNEIQVTQKQLSIIKQKSMKIDTDLQKSEIVTREMDNDIKIYLKKVARLNEKTFKKHVKHETEESECEEEHSQLLVMLKENEMGVLNLEGDINDLQIEIENYKDLVLDKHRESLTWETKCKLVIETLRWRKKEQALNSEIGIMKNDIQRLRLRYTQLTRHQEKLSKDMVHCIMHRETMLSVAAFKSRAETLSSKVAISTHQKVKEIRNKLKQIQNEISSLTDEQLVDAIRENDRLQNDIEKICSETSRENSNDKLIRDKIDEGIIMKHFNLENIVRKQNRAKSYRKLCNSAFPVKTPRSAITLQSLMQKQTDINEQLSTIILTLTTDWPEKKICFIKISQILNS